MDCFVLNNNVTHFNSSGLEHIQKKIRRFIGNKNKRTNIFRIKAYDSLICGYFYIGFIDFSVKGKNLTDFTKLFSQGDLKK